VTCQPVEVSCRSPAFRSADIRFRSRTNVSTASSDWRRRSVCSPNTGFDEGVAGHITARDPEHSDHFWVNPFAMHFGQISVSDSCSSTTGEVVEGEYPVNEAAFVIHSQVHAARPDVVRAAHSHSLYGKRGSSLGSCSTRSRRTHARLRRSRPLRRLHGRSPRSRGRQAHRPRRRRQQGGDPPQPRAADCRALGGRSVRWFIAMERCCHAQLLADAAGTPISIDTETPSSRPTRSAAISPVAELPAALRGHRAPSRPDLAGLSGTRTIPFRCRRCAERRWGCSCRPRPGCPPGTSGLLWPSAHDHRCACPFCGMTTSVESTVHLRFRDASPPTPRGSSSWPPRVWLLLRRPARRSYSLPVSGWGAARCGSAEEQPHGPATRTSPAGLAARASRSAGGRDSTLVVMPQNGQGTPVIVRRGHRRPMSREGRQDEGGTEHPHRRSAQRRHRKGNGAGSAHPAGRAARARYLVERWKLSHPARWLPTWLAVSSAFSVSIEMGVPPHPRAAARDNSVPWR